MMKTLKKIFVFVGSIRIEWGHAEDARPNGNAADSLEKVSTGTVGGRLTTGGRTQVSRYYNSSRY
ncbi:hypothetical protein [Herbaspirillum sp.]|uniref:hypothetical protein n=1 Tax=Herbaspirillum sp. TaxID=1890675 RepID=UPI000C0BB70A|nr:hypothetical protein [Herbaspirillum sp.]MAF04701.1 hypothetical protein [Herbaspirillum sp.]|tara:strand:- start:618 stop:812 length:195 start_codon:yes stop_codon:yes gene_type:complete